MQKTAIIGLSCLFPGASTPESYWQNLLAGHDCRTDATAEDFGMDISGQVGDGPESGKIYSVRGGFVRDFRFDPEGLDLAPEVLERLDPSFLWAMHAAREALRDAGVKSAPEAGVILGNYTFPTLASNRMTTRLWHQRILDGLSDGYGLETIDTGMPELDPANRYVCGMPAALTARALGLYGPSFSLDAACSSALYAIDLAASYLRAGKTRVMLAGALCAPDPWLIHLSFSNLGAYPPNGFSQPFDKRSQGIVTGQGASIVVLKRLEDALEDGDNILCVIDGIGLSNDGTGRHMLAPNPRGQAMAYERAYAESGIDPSDIDYIECHATGTPLGDKTEIGSLKAFFGEAGGTPKFGSVKANLGHLLTVAGMSSLAKVAMSMKEGVIPATIGIGEAQADITGLVKEPVPWPNTPRPKRAAISAFGFGGANAHMVISEVDGQSAPAPKKTVTPRPMIISGMATHLGKLTTLNAFEQALFSGASALGTAGPNRGRGAELPEEGGYVDSIDLDPLAGRVPPTEIAHFNPQHALTMQVADTALRDAGFERKADEPRNVAVLVALELDLTAHLRRARAELPGVVDGWMQRLGITLKANERETLLEQCAASLHDDVKSAEILSYIGNICAGRVSSLWNFSGPSYTISADGQSVTYALEAAQMMLTEKRVDAALVAVVDLGAGFEDAALSKVDPDATPGEGAAAIVLRAADQGHKGYAIIDKLSIIRGHSPDNTLPEPTEETRKQALTMVGGERAELVETLSGSDSLTGRNMALAPMAGVIKSALSLWRRALPVGPERPASMPWCRSQPTKLLRAIVSIPGFAGAQSAIGLTEPSEAASHKPVSGHAEPFAFLPVAGADATTFQAALEALIAALQSGAPLAQIQRQSIKATTPGQPGLAGVLIGSGREALGKDAARLLEQLPSLLASGGTFQTPGGSYFTAAPLGHEGKVAFVYPGGFNSYPFLGAGLLRNNPDTLRRFEAQLEDPRGALCIDALFPAGLSPADSGRLMTHEAAMMDDIATMIISGASFALLYTDILRQRFGVKANAKFGYSLGETSMLFASGAWPPEARSMDRVRSSELLQTGIAGPKTLARKALGLGADVRDRKVWTSVVVFDEADRVIAASERHKDAYVTHVNTPREVVVAGRPDAVKAMLAELEADTFRSPMAHVLHCDVLRGDYAEVAALNDFPSGTPEKGVTLYSALTNAPLDEFDRPALTRTVADVMCSRVDFRKLTECIYADGVRLFIECGPSATCTRWISSILEGRPHLAIPLDQRGADDEKNLLMALGRLFAHGVKLDLSSLAPALDPLRPRTLVSVRTGGPDLYTNAREVAGSLPTPKHQAIPDINDNELTPLIYGPAAGLLYPEPAKMETPMTNYESAPTHAGDNKHPKKGNVTPFPLSAAIESVAREHNRYLEAQTALARYATAEQLSLDPIVEQHILALLDADPAEELCSEPQNTQAPGPRTNARPEGVIWDEHDLLNFADGKVADVFGEEFAEIDTYPVRVRLPSKPYFFVSRVTKLDARPGEYQPCSLTTEYDIPHDAWYLVDGQMPPGVAVEAGQSDLLLIAYLGIDKRNKGERKYRLLDGKLAFKGPLPRAGQTLRFDIKINSFVWQGDTLLFFFSYKGYVDGELALELESGCAGFFTEPELEASGGVVLKGERPLTEHLQKPVQASRKKALDRADMIALSEGRTGDVFGSAHQGLGESMRLPPEMLLMVDRITDLGSWREEPKGRVFVIEAEKDLDPGGWYYASHFVDDPVLPGSLAAEGATQVLKAYLLANGYHLTIANAEFDSIPEVLMDIKVRGQITPKVDTLRYEVRVIETGLLPRPFIRADVVIWHGDKPLVQVSNLALQVREKASIEPRLGDESWESGRRTSKGEKVLLSELHLAHAAKGDLKTAMGTEFGIYGLEHRAPHIPNGCFQFVDRGVHINGARGTLKPGAIMINEYDSPADAWYYTENSFPRMPNCVYLESALQAAILLGYYLGPTLKYPQNVYSIRNLDGKAVYLADIDTRGKTLRHTETLKTNTLIPDSILQNFDFSVECDGTPVYEGWSSFGYFTEKALAVQLGLDKGATRNFWHEDNPTQLTEIDLTGADTSRYFAAPQGKPHYRLAGGRFRLLHKAWMAQSGGNYGQGYIKGYREVRDEDWYFTNHFHRDPVQPGSLGLESMLQSIQLFALANDIGARFKNPRFGIAVGVPVEWKYRGQILRRDRDMFTETHIKEIREEDARTVLIADAVLFNDRLPIYDTISMSVAITEAED